MRILDVRKPCEDFSKQGLLPLKPDNVVCGQYYELTLLCCLFILVNTLNYFPSRYIRTKHLTKADGSLKAGCVSIKLFSYQSNLSLFLYTEDKTGTSL